MSIVVAALLGLVVLTTVLVVDSINFEFEDRIVIDEALTNQNSSLEETSSVYRELAISDARLTTHQVFYC